MNSKFIQDTMDAVFCELMAMPREKLLREFSLKGNGDIAAILRFTESLKVRECEAIELAYPATDVRVAPVRRYGEKTLVGVPMHSVIPVLIPRFVANKEYDPLGPTISSSLFNAKVVTTYSAVDSDEFEWAMAA